MRRQHHDLTNVLFNICYYNLLNPILLTTTPLSPGIAYNLLKSSLPISSSTLIQSINLSKIICSHERCHCLIGSKEQNGIVLSNHCTNERYENIGDFLAPNFLKACVYIHNCWSNCSIVKSECDNVFMNIMVTDCISSNVGLIDRSKCIMNALGFTAIVMLDHNGYHDIQKQTCSCFKHKIITIVQNNITLIPFNVSNYT